MDSLLGDLRYAARKLALTPGFTVVAVLTLGLAIGATTTVYSVVDAVLIRPLPFTHPEQLVRVGTVSPSGESPWASPLDIKDYLAQSHTLAALVPVKSASSISVQRDAGPTLHLTWARVGAGFFSLLGVQPELGRTFASGEDAPGSPKIAILSDATWRDVYNGDPRIVGRTIRLTDEPYTVVGVAPAWFRYPDSPDFWVPLVYTMSETRPQGRALHELTAVGRLRADADLASARQDLDAISRRLQQQYPVTNAGYHAITDALKSQMVGPARSALLVMLGAVGLVLLMACANVANLLLVRATARETEIAVRTALGASRWRIVRQILIESVMLSVAGFVLGAAIAAWTVKAIVAFGPHGLPRLDEIVVNLRVLGATAAIALATGLAFGLIPALQATGGGGGHEPTPLREAGRGLTRASVARTRGVLVMGEMALAVILLVGAGLLVRSLVRLTDVNPGFHAEQVLAFDLALDDVRYPYDAQVNALANTLSDRIRALPGTQSVGISDARPFQTMRSFEITTSFQVEGRPKAEPGKEPHTELAGVSSGYFQALAIPVIAGRGFADADDRRAAPPAVVVNEAFAKRYFPGGGALGQQIVLGITHTTGSAPGDTLTSSGAIIGVVADTKDLSLADTAAPRTYVPFSALPLHVSVTVRTTQVPATLFPAIRSIVADVDPTIALYDLTTMTQALDASVAQPRFYAVILGAFASIALVLAMLGIYGVISYAVSQRTSELGLRMALGASPRHVLHLILGGGLALAAAGVVIGVLGAAVLTRWISSLLFGVAPLDPLTYGAVVAALFGVALVASWVPARRAARVDPAIAMRVP
jgi:putative ABC transport system permease protein